MKEAKNKYVISNSQSNFNKRSFLLLAFGFFGTWQCFDLNFSENTRTQQNEHTAACMIFFSSCTSDLLSLVLDSGHRGCSPASSQSTIGPLYRQRCTSDTCLLQKLDGKQWKVVTNKKESPVFSQTLVIFQWPMILGKISSGWISLSMLRFGSVSFKALWTLHFACALWTRRTSHMRFLYRPGTVL